MNIQFANFYKVRLALSVAPGDTSITVSSTTGAPSTGGGLYFYAIMTDAATGSIHEIVKVTNVSGAVFTVTRAQGGTTAQSFSVNDYFAVGWTKESFTDVVGAGVLQIANNLSDVASPTTSATNIGLGAGNSVTFAGLTVNGSATLGVGSGSLVATSVASAVNYLNITGATTGNTPSLSATGSDTNVGLNVTTKGSGGFNFQTATSTTQLNIAHTATAVNYLSITGATTGTRPAITAIGGDANIGITIGTKAAGPIYFQSDANTIFAIARGSTATVNYPQFNGAATGGTPTLYFIGSDTDVSGAITTKGNGSLQFVTGTSNTQMIVTNTASNVNYWSITGATTGNAPTFTATGSDTNVSMNLSTKGTGNVVLNAIPKFAGTNTTGAGSAALGSNCPASTVSAPYKWIQAVAADGSTVYIPAWK